MLESDIKKFKSGYKFEAISPRDYDLNNEKLSTLSDEALLAEYARVSKQASLDANEYDKEIKKLIAHRKKLTEMLKASEDATKRGTELSKIFEELNSSGAGALTQSDLVWVEFEVYVRPKLSERSYQIKEAMKRLDSRISNLRSLSDGAKEIREIMDSYRWYEFMRQLVASEPDIPGVAEIITGGEVGISAGSDASRSIITLIKETKAKAKITDFVIGRLVEDARRKDSEAAKTALIRQIANVTSATLSAIQSSAGSDSSDQTSFSVSITTIKFGEGVVDQLLPPTISSPPLDPVPIPQPFPDTKLNSSTPVFID